MLRKWWIVLCAIVLVQHAMADETVDASGDNWTELREQIDAQLLNRASNDGFSGSVMISRGGDTLIHTTIGNKATSSGYEPAYWIASGTKQFMGAVMAQLAHDGVIELDASISEYLDDVPADKKGITIMQLLTHTSGLRQAYAAEGITERDEALQRILKRRLSAKPGEKYIYSNDGFTLLAIIAETVANQSFESLMQQQLDLANMQHSGLWGFENGAELARLPNAKAASRQSKSIYRDGHSVANWGYRGATGIYATAGDFHSWLQLLMNCNRPECAHLAQVAHPQRWVREIKDFGDVYYGLGLAVIQQGDTTRMVSHIGDDDWLGHNSTVSAYADGDIIVVLSNSGYLEDGTPWSAQIMRDVRAILQK